MPARLVHSNQFLDNLEKLTITIQPPSRIPVSQRLDRRTYSVWCTDSGLHSAAALMKPCAACDYSMCRPGGSFEGHLLHLAETSRAGSVNKLRANRWLDVLLDQLLNIMGGFQHEMTKNRRARLHQNRTSFRYAQFVDSFADLCELNIGIMPERV